MSSTTRNAPSGLNRQGHPLSTSALAASGPNTPPLKLTKQTTAYASSSSLVGGVPGGAPLARRSSACFNHVRTSSLVSSSPFKTGGNTTSATSPATPKPQHAQSQSQHVISPTGGSRTTSGERFMQSQIHGRSKSDENKASDNVRRPRESSGFQNLPKQEAVTRSPFVEPKGVPPGSRIGFSMSTEFPKDLSSSSTAHNIVKSSSYPSAANPTGTMSSSSILAPNHALASQRTLPATPQRPRPMSMNISIPASASPLSSSPRSNLVSKRLFGPRSPDGSAADTSLKRQRRKTVTWDERCDVMEFDQESEATESVLGSEDNKDNDETEESEHEQEPTPGRRQPEVAEFFGPDRDDVRTPSPTLSGSINDAVEEMEVAEKISQISALSDDESATPQRETIALPTEASAYHHDDHDLSMSHKEMQSFLSNHESFREDSVSTHEDSFTSRIKTEPGVETSLRLSETRSPERFPRISRDAIRRQVEQKRLDTSFDGHQDSQTRPRMSSDSIRDHSFHDREHSAPVSPFRASFTDSPSGKERHPEHILSSSFHGNRSDVHLEDLEDVHSALDRLMLGVEKGFEPSIMSNASNMDEDHMSTETVSDNESFAPQAYGQAPEGLERTIIIDEDDPTNYRESVAMSGADTESTDGPETPQMHETASLDSYQPAKEMDLTYSSSKPLPPPPDAFTPPPAVHVTLDSDDDTPVAPEPMHSLPVPAGQPVRRGNTIKMREEAIKAKRREQRALEGRPSRRRSHSTPDLHAELDEPEQLNLPHADDVDLTDAFQSEVARLQPKSKVLYDPSDGRVIDAKPRTQKTYMMKQRRPTIYASDSRVGHLGVAGDVHGGRAWKAVRRPSDMNEYSKQIRQIRNQGKANSSHGKVFVKVLGIRNLDVPLPHQPTYFTCVLNNGIHFVETPASKFENESLIDQEFELIEHDKLEFTLTIKVRKDPHINQILNPPARPAYTPPRVETPTKTSRGMRSFFSSPAKKPSKPVMKEREPTPQPIETTDPFGRYLKKDLSIAKALVTFKDILTHCDTKLFETSYPLVGQCLQGREYVTKTVGEIVLQIFRLPPIAGVPQDELPQSLEECLRGLRHVQWHKVVYHEGVLTQLGGDCTTWRRRNLQVMGANIIAYNDITKKPITSMDLRKVTLVEDDGRAGSPPTVITPPSQAVLDGALEAPKRGLRRQRSFNALAGIEHSFRVIFDNNENDEVCFFADSAEEKQRWLEIFGALIGRIPHNPLWAEVVWQRQQEAA